MADRLSANLSRASFGGSPALRRAVYEGIYRTSLMGRSRRLLQALVLYLDDYLSSPRYGRHSTVLSRELLTRPDL